MVTRSSFTASGDVGFDPEESTLTVGEVERYSVVTAEGGSLHVVDVGESRAREG